MDADFVSSVAAVGDRVEIKLSFGDQVVGDLVELAADRLRVRQDDGADVALLLSTILMVRRVVGLGPPPAPLLVSLASPLASPVAQLPAPPQPVETPAAQSVPPAQQPVQQPVAAPAVAPAPVVHEEPVPEVLVEPYDDLDPPLDTLSEETALPVRTRLTGAEECRRDLESICNSLADAQRVHELEPRFGKVTRLLERARPLQRRDPYNPDMFYLCGVLAFLSEKYETARPYLATGADLDGGDEECARLLAVASARLHDHETAAFALIKYFRLVPPHSDPTLWPLLLRVVDRYRLGRGVLHELLGVHDAAASTELVEAALRGTTPPETPLVRPTGATRRPLTHAPVVATAVRPVVTMPVAKAAPGAKSAFKQNSALRRSDGYYQQAKRLELTEKNFAGAKLAYREAIRRGERVESAVKDLAWLTKRTEDAQAALDIITKEFAGLVSKGDALDNILIDFLVGTGEFEEALVVLERQFRRGNLAVSKRNHLRHQIAYTKLSAGKDSVEDWHAVMVATDTPAARRGMALALIQRGGERELARAEEVLSSDDDDKAVDIRRRIDQIRTGESSGVDPRWANEILGKLDQLAITPLVDFVMANYSSGAVTVREQRQREKSKKPTRGDAHRLAENAHRQRGRVREASADSYISAAVLAWETHRDDFLELLCSGVTALADVVLERSAEAARGLYLEALRIADRLEEQADKSDASLALSRFLRSLDGRRALRSFHGNTEARLGKLVAVLHAQHGDEVFDLVTQLVSQVDEASDQVLEAIFTSDKLRAAAVKYLADRQSNGSSLTSADEITRVWRKLGEREAQRYPEASAQLQFLADIRLTEDVLDGTVERLDTLTPDILDPALRGRLADGLRRLRAYLYETSFEDREASLRHAAELMRQIQQNVRHAPTRVAVELVWPTSVKVGRMVDEAHRALISQYPPKPTITQELATSTVDKSRVITVQVKVGNEMHAAPLESPILRCSNVPDWFQAEETTMVLPSAVRGGQHYIQVVRLRATDKALAAGAFTLNVSLEYHARGTEDLLTTTVTLAVRLLSEADFHPIAPNPFVEGASGKTVTDPEMFVGRGEVLRRIQQHFENARTPGSGVAIFGQKRAGKSSIRIHLKSELQKRPDFIVVDLENIATITPDPGNSTRVVAQVLWAIVEQAEREIAERFGDRGPDRLFSGGWTRAEFLAEDQPVSAFVRLVRDYLDAWPATNRPTMIVMIDEFQYFEHWIREKLLAPSFMQSLKAIIERRLFHMVIVGQDALERLIADHANVFGVFATERVSYLDSASAELLIDKPILDRGGSRFRGVAKERIAELTGGSAYYIQRFCRDLVEYMNQQQAPLVTEADVERVRTITLRSLRASNFDNLETAGYTDPDRVDASTYRSALLAIARAGKNGPATYDSVAEVYDGVFDLKTLLDDLVLRDVVRVESGGYRIVVRLYQDWLLSSVAQSGSQA
ncbi:ATP-binding protein [Lentzea terrae]|uniref:ATP-binding protein n=1 Tax=Lentzea terrae TaxID=2200761 RepID=UPI000DD49902|nr:ATP-binding protein [Lentzea terrae]